MDAEDPSDTADIIDADVYEQLTHNAQNFTAYPEQERSVEQTSPAQSQSIEPQHPPPISPICSEPDDLNPLPELVVDRFPYGSAGVPVPGVHQGLSLHRTSLEALGTSIWAPFRSQCDWELAHWAKMRGPTSSAVAALLAVPQLVDRLELSYRNTRELDAIIDQELPGRPPFKCWDLLIGGETLHLYYRDIIQCLRSLFGDPELARDMVFAPERHYTERDRTCRVYSDMHTGDWWWAVQTSLESRRPGATVIPVILSSDKTQLTLFRGNAAYPVYMTIGNVPKEIRRKPSHRAQILMGYIPTTKLTSLTNKAGRRRALANLFHACVQVILAPIAGYGETGVTMKSGDGTWRRCHPIFALFVGDYPEQILVTCTYSGQCPKCAVPHNRLGEFVRFPLRNYDRATQTYSLVDEDVHVFHAACREVGLKPIFHPFWESLPLVNIFVSITPDILHQMLQGVMKHLIAWLTRSSVFGPGQIDTRCRSLPPNHHIKTFSNGITILSRVSGQEHKEMCRILLGLIVDLPLPSGQVTSRIVRSVRALLDFLYLAQLPSQTTDTITRLDEALARFHSNKAVFVDLGVREHFNIPKFHSLMHYSTSIALFGTTDNYNTEQTERLHIDFTKDAYRATNHKDEYPQMTTWLERREKVLQHTAFIKRWQQPVAEERSSQPPIGPSGPVPRSMKMTRNPSAKAVSFDHLSEKHGAIDFQDALADFIARVNHPEASAAALRTLAADTLIPFRSVPVFYRIKFTSNSTSTVIDAVHVRPEQRDTHGRSVPSRFDTVIVHHRHQPGGRAQGNKFNGQQIAQVRVVFQLPARSICHLFPSLTTVLPTHLAYVEWFSPIPATPDANSLLYRVSRLTRNGRREASIIPVDSIFSSVHLFPRFGQQTHAWNTFSALESCHSFYINPFSDRDMYLVFS
ncbi:hypothetical protein EDB89DRAFT_1853464 [Lactarius sanguifluus]|nr:hypothetical protein EDB89DRAFT_1853464 [Lactarius sanguifluus]